MERLIKNNKYFVIILLIVFNLLGFDYIDEKINYDNTKYMFNEDIN